MKLILITSIILSAFIFSACSNSGSGSNGGGAAAPKISGTGTTVASAYVLTTYSADEQAYIQSITNSIPKENFEYINAPINTDTEKVLTTDIPIHQFIESSVTGSGTITYKENSILLIKDISMFQGSLICLKKCILAVPEINQKMIDKLKLQGDIRIYDAYQIKE